ncbi:MAG: hypothetical protein M3Z08_22410 [Chloroflexota bacterium]|nr:hypothetical protein [Chloroflexota bacterium]
MQHGKWYLSLMLLCIVTGLMLSACGSRVGTSSQGIAANAQPDTLTITIPSLALQRPVRIQILAKVDQVRQLYRVTTTLPPYQQPPACTQQMGVRYGLTFLAGGKKMVSATYDSSGCGLVTFNQNDRRNPTQEFSVLLGHAIKDTTPPVQMDQLIVIHTVNASQPPIHAKIGAAGAQRIYDALLKLPTSANLPECANTTGPRYDLSFQQANGDFPLDITIAATGCTSFVEEKIRTATPAFRYLLEQKMAEAGAATARPDSLALAISDANTAKKGLMVDRHDLLDTLYRTIYALPPAQNQAKSCTTQGTQKHYSLFFEQDGVFILTVEAYKGGKAGCERVTFADGSVRQPDQQFWTLVEQAQAIAIQA